MGIKGNCYLCGNQTHLKEMFDFIIDCEYFGVKGCIYVLICKECYREEQLKKLFKSENTE